MHISVRYDKGEYHWELYDGPDGIDHFTGTANSVGEAFEAVIKQQLLNSLRY